jgi:hypothetical protein
MTHRKSGAATSITLKDDATILFPGEHVAATPTTEKDADTPLTPHEYAAAKSTTWNVAAAGLTPRESVAATPTACEDVGALTPGENARATPTTCKDAAAALTPEKNAAATQTTCKDAAGIFTPGEHAVATATTSKDATATPTLGEHAAARTTPVESTATTLAQEFAEDTATNTAPLEHSVVSPTADGQALCGKESKCTERKGHASSSQAHRGRRPASAAGKLVQTSDGHHRLTSAPTGGPKHCHVGGKGSGRRVGECDSAFVGGCRLQGRTAAIEEAAAAVREELLAARWDAFQRAMLKLAKRSNSRRQSARRAHGQSPKH